MNSLKLEFRKKEEKERNVFDLHMIAYRCVFAEALLKYSLFEAFDKAVDIDLVYNKYGKPRMRNIEKFFLIFLIREIGLWLHMEKRKLELISKKYDLKKCQLLIVF